MFTDAVLLWLITILFSSIVVIGASSISFTRVDFSKDEETFLGLPIILASFSAIGSWLTVGYKGNISLLFPPLLLFLGWVTGLRVKKPQIDFLILIFIIVFCTLMFGIKVASSFDFNSNIWLVTHHDTYFYTYLLNSINAEKAESGILQLALKSFDLPYDYKFYHYIEFYIVTFLKKISNINSFLYVNLFFPIFFSLIGIYCAFLFFYIRFKNKYSKFKILLIVSSLFMSMRFIYVDDYLHSLIYKLGFDLLVLQNFYAPHPFSYFRGYKIALTLIFCLPVIHVSMKQKQFLTFGFVSLASLASVALTPFSLLIAVFHHPYFRYFQNRWGLRIWILPVAAALLLAWFAKPIGFPNFSASYIFRTVLITFNQLVEDHFFQFGVMSIMLLMCSKQKQTHWFGLLILSFPLIYFKHSWLFKLYLPLFLVLGFLLIKKNKTEIRFPQIAISLLVLLIITRGYSYIININQVYTNLIYMFVLLLTIATVLEHTHATRQNLLVGISLIVIMLSGHAAYEQNKIPLTKEILPTSLISQLVNLQDRVNLLAVSQLDNIYVLNSQLGWSINHYTDLVQVIQGGFEFLSPQQVSMLKDSGFDIQMDLSPLKGHNMQDLESEKSFLLEKFKYLLVEAQPQFDRYHEFGRKYSTNSYYIETGKYWIYVLN